MSRTLSVDSLLKGNASITGESGGGTEYVPLGELCLAITRGITVSNDERITYQPGKVSNIAYVGPGSFQNYKLDYWNTSFFNGYVEAWDKGRVDKGDLLLSKTITPPKAFVMDFPEDARVIASSNLFILKLDKEKIDPVYLMAWLNTVEGQDMLKEKGVGEKRTKAIPIDSIRTLKIPVPPMEEQKVLAALFSEKVKKVQRLTEELKAMEWALGGLHRSAEFTDITAPEYIFSIMVSDHE